MKRKTLASTKPLSDNEYHSIMRRVAKENHTKWDETEEESYNRIINDDTYNYRGYYNKYPNSQANADTHWTDEFKTVKHPTFSNESIYSGKKSKYNPLGLTGGLWVYPYGNETFIPTLWQYMKK